MRVCNFKVFAANSLFTSTTVYFSSTTTGNVWKITSRYLHY